MYILKIMEYKIFKYEDCVGNKIYEKTILKKI